VAGLAIAILFVLMVAAPCLIALRNSRGLGDIDDFVPEEFETDEPALEEIAPERFDLEPLGAAHASSPTVRAIAQRTNALSRRVMAMEAEVAALKAKNRADRAHWEALTAAARAAGLRADAASEAAQAASLAALRAIWAAETEFDYELEYVPENHPSLDSARAQASSRRAA